MATKQWIGIEEAATKYQVSTRRIITWCKRQEIIYSEVGDYLMLDENSLTDCLERNIRLFPALCTMGDEESTDESSNVPDFPLK